MYLLHEVLLSLKLLAYKWTEKREGLSNSAQLRLYIFFLYVNASMFLK